jgi:hypothetical protein
VIGYAVLRNREIRIGGEYVDSAIIEDLIVAGARQKQFGLAIAALTRYSCYAQLVLFITLLQKDALNSAISRFLGPLKKWHTMEGPELLVWGKRKKDCPWFFTNILSEGVAYDGSHKI